MTQPSIIQPSMPPSRHAACKMIAGSLAMMLLVGCKPEPPPVPVPLTKSITGVAAPCEQLTYGGFPRKEPIVSGTYFVCRPGYALNMDVKRKTPEWVVEHLISTNLAAAANHQNIDDTRPDPAIPPSKRTLPNDYTGMGYVRAFLAPPEDFANDDILYSHAFYLSNATPIRPDVLPLWKHLEQATRTWALSHHELYVISGPIYANGQGLGWIGQKDQDVSVKFPQSGQVQIPTHLFKILIDPNTSQGIAFVVPNDQAPRTTNLWAYATTIATVEKAAQLHVAPDVSQAQHAQIAQQSVLAAWAPPKP